MVVKTKSHTASKEKLLRRRLGFVIVLFVGLLASLALHHFTQRAEHRRIEDEFFRRAFVRHALIAESLHVYEECLYSLRNLFASSDEVTPTEFLATTRDIRARHNGIQALQWVPIVPNARRAEIESWARKEIAPFYAFTERGPDGQLIPAEARPAYKPILYTDPVKGNEPALGFDVGVGPSKHDIERSLRSRSLVMTGKIRLVQEQPGVNRFGVIMICPVFHTLQSTEQAIGFVQIVFKVDELLEQSSIGYSANTLETLILDVTDSTNTDQFLYSRRSIHSDPSEPLQSIADLPRGVSHTDKLIIGGRTWKCYYAPSEGWINDQVSATPNMVFAGGLVFTFVLGAYFMSVHRRSELVARQVNERTAELRHTQGLLEADIHKRQTAEAELRESRRQLDGLLGQMPGIAYRYVNTTPRTATFISRGSIEIVGYTPHELTSGKVCYENLIFEEDRARHQAEVVNALSKKDSYESEYRLRDKQGGTKWVLDRGQGIYSSEGPLLFIEGLAIDITGRKQAEADKAAFDRKLLESQKLESLGLLAGGIAHDFNNLLTTIVGHASIARLDLPQHSPTQINLEQIEAGAQRAGELCQQMLAYAGKGRFLVQRTSLEKLVRDTTPLLEHSISKRAHLGFDFRSGVPEVDVDATQIRQIIMNLVVNASDAIGDEDGFITVETCLIRRNDPQLSHAVLPVPPGQGDFAGLRVRDTGQGMSAETIGKIFDPFFTTKFAGRGLGLAAVLGIVRSHQGSLLVTSIPHAGSTFTLLLPATSAQELEDEASTTSETHGRPFAGTILLIDDEEGVRAVAEQMFSNLGLKTVVAADGEEGIERFKQHQPDICLVLLDLTMPRMSGAETLRALRLIAPRLPVILMSGYNESSIPELGTDDLVAFLQKPFSLHSLRTQIGRMLS